MKDEVWINPMYKGKKGEGVKLEYVVGDREIGKRVYYISKMERIMFPYFKDLNDADRKIIRHHFKSISTGFSVDFLQMFIEEDFEKALVKYIIELKKEKGKKLYDNYLNKEVITFKDYNKAIKEIEECH